MLYTLPLELGIGFWILLQSNIILSLAGMSYQMKWYLLPHFITSALISGLQLINICVYKNFSYMGRALQQAINQKVYEIQ